MLTHYFELRLIPQIEISELAVMNEMLQKLHLLLVNSQANIGISFPCYVNDVKQSLGGIIRLMGSQSELQALSQQITLNDFIINYAVLLPIAEIPNKLKGYLRVKRMHSKGQSALRRAEKRLSQQGKWSPEVKENFKAYLAKKQLHYPYVHLKSLSNGQSFILWIKQEKHKEAIKGQFNGYGLSNIATVPDF